jgi:hypothetical protein
LKIAKEKSQHSALVRDSSFLLCCQHYCSWERAETVRSSGFSEAFGSYKQMQAERCAARMKSLLTEKVCGKHGTSAMNTERRSAVRQASDTSEFP